MDTYEKKYKNALEWARQVMNGETGFIRKEVEEVFPELKESEDERIRKALISFLKSPFVNENITDEKVTPWIAWLEKQGDKAKFIKKELDCIHDYREKSIKRLEELEKQCEQELVSTWSEEDENHKENSIYFLEASKKYFKKDEDIVYDERWIDTCIEWLKSLKGRIHPQSQWKPSDEQMENLSRAFNGATYQVSLLRDLYLDLKKLKG